jgi:hypothetical protein
MRAINQHEKQLFDCIRQPNGDHLALVSTELNGIETACISWIEPDGKDYAIQPLAVLVNDDLFPLLKNP